jgi:hypothetical protein
MQYLNTLWQGVANALDTIVSVIKSMRGDPAAWESSIRKFEAQD